MHFDVIDFLQMLNLLFSNIFDGLFLSIIDLSNIVFSFSTAGKLQLFKIFNKIVNCNFRMISFDFLISVVLTYSALVFAKFSLQFAESLRTKIDYLVVALVFGFLVDDNKFGLVLDHS